MRPVLVVLPTLCISKGLTRANLKRPHRMCNTNWAPQYRHLNLISYTNNQDIFGKNCLLFNKKERQGFLQPYILINKFKSLFTVRFCSFQTEQKRTHRQLFAFCQISLLCPSRRPFHAMIISTSPVKIQSWAQKNIFLFALYKLQDFP